MSTPGKEAYTRKKAATGGQDATSMYPRKKAAVNGSDAKPAYKRRKQIVNNLRTRLAK